MNAEKNTQMAERKPNPLKRILELLKYEKVEITSIYFYAILGGLVQLSLPLGIQTIISFVLGGSVSTSLVLLIIFVVLGVFIYGLLQVNQMKIIERIQQQMFVRYSFHYSDAIPRLDLRAVDGYYLPELTNRFFDTISLQKGISKILISIPAATIQILFGLFLLSFYHPAFIFFGIMLITILYLILRLTGNRGFVTSMQESEYKYRVAGYLEELARVVTSFKFSRAASLHLRHTDKDVTGYLQSRTAHFRILLLQYWILIGFKVLITASMLVVGALLLVDQKLNVGQFIAAEIVILTVINSVEKIIGNLDNVYDVLTSLEKLNKLLDKPREENGEVIAGHANTGIGIQAGNLSFAYGSGRRVLQSLSFAIKPGEKVAVCGAYGSGKSTLLKVLAGLYPPAEGSLLLDDIPILRYDKPSLRKQVGLKLNTQDIFEGTLLDNIAMGDDSLTYSYLNGLAAVVGLSRFIESAPEGLQMQLQPGGQHLSGKIVKKILLMRALAGSPRLLLLEEPWLGLEEEYRNSIKNYILHQMPATTAVIVTGDTGFAAAASQVLVLGDGELVAAGSWAQVSAHVKKD